MSNVSSKTRKNTTVELKEPVVYFDKKDNVEKTLASVTFKRLRLKHLKYFPKGMLSGDDGDDINPEEFFPLMAKLSDIPKFVFEEIPVSELGPLMDAFNENMGESQPSQKDGMK